MFRRILIALTAILLALGATSILLFVRPQIRTEHATSLQPDRGPSVAHSPQPALPDSNLASALPPFSTAATTTLTSSPVAIASPAPDSKTARARRSSSPPALSQSYGSHTTTGAYPNPAAAPSAVPDSSDIESSAAATIPARTPRSSRIDGNRGESEIVYDLDYGVRVPAALFTGTLEKDTAASNSSIVAEARENVADEFFDGIENPSGDVAQSDENISESAESSTSPETFQAIDGGVEIDASVWENARHLADEQYRSLFGDEAFGAASRASALDAMGLQR